LPVVGTEIEDLAALGSPEGGEAKVSEIIEGLEKALRSAERDPESIRKSLGPFTAPGELAARYGFKECEKPL